MKDTLELSHVPSAMWGHSEKASCVALAIHRICVCLGLPYLQNCEKPVSVVYQPPTWLLVFCLSTRNGLGPWAMCGDALGSSWLSGDCLENWNSWLQPTGQRGSPWLCSSVSVLCTPHGGLPDPPLLPVLWEGNVLIQLDVPVHCDVGRRKCQNFHIVNFYFISVCFMMKMQVCKDNTCM